MNITDRRVVQFREWAERRFGIGSGGYAEGEDLLSVVMDAVDRRERLWQESATEALQPHNDPAFLNYLNQVMRDIDG